MDEHMRKPLTESELHSYLMAIGSLASAFDAIGDHVVITDSNAVVIYANEAVTRNTGFSRDAVIGKNPGDLWGGNMPKEFYEKMWHTIKDEKRPFTGEIRNTRQDGTEYWQEIHISPVLDTSGEVKFFIGIEPNITDRKQREQFRDEFVSVVGHQMKNPLTAIRWTLEWLLRSGGLTPEQKTALETVYAENHGLIDLIGDMLVTARMGQLTAMHEPVDLVRVLDGIIEIVRVRFPDVSFSLKKSEDTVVVSSVPPLVHEVFINIITNAAEYSNKKGGEVVIRLATEATMHIVSCKDNGIGIPLEDQSKIFSRMFRASNARLMKENGTGLGLFIVKTIASGLGWSVLFQSVPGEGTTFFVQIPK